MKRANEQVQLWRRHMIKNSSSFISDSQIKVTMKHYASENDTNQKQKLKTICIDSDVVKRNSHPLSGILPDSTPLKNDVESHLAL